MLYWTSFECDTLTKQASKQKNIIISLMWYTRIKLDSVSLLPVVMKFMSAFESKSLLRPAIEFHLSFFFFGAPFIVVIWQKQRNRNHSEIFRFCNVFRVLYVCECNMSRRQHNQIDVCVYCVWSKTQKWLEKSSRFFAIRHKVVFVVNNCLITSVGI